MFGVRWRESPDASQARLGRLFLARVSIPSTSDASRYVCNIPIQLVYCQQKGKSISTVGLLGMYVPCLPDGWSQVLLDASWRPNQVVFVPQYLRSEPSWIGLAYPPKTPRQATNETKRRNFSTAASCWIPPPYVGPLYCTLPLDHRNPSTHTSNQTNPRCNYQVVLTWLGSSEISTRESHHIRHERACNPPSSPLTLRSNQIPYLRMLRTY